MKICFDNKPDNIERQVKQVMRENYAQMEDQIFENCASKIDAKFSREFAFKIFNAQNFLGKNDLKSVLTTLIDAYESSNMQKDAEVLNNQIKKLDIQG